MKFNIKLNTEQIEKLVDLAEKDEKRLKRSLRFFGEDVDKTAQIERIEKAEMLTATLKTHL